MGHEQKIVIPTLGLDSERAIMKFSGELGKIFAVETSSPSNGSNGYSAGCLLIDTSVTNGPTMQINNGSLESSQFANLAQP